MRHNGRDGFLAPGVAGDRIDEREYREWPLLTCSEGAVYHRSRSHFLPSRSTPETFTNEALTTRVYGSAVEAIATFSTGSSIGYKHSALERDRTKSAR